MNWLLGRLASGWGLEAVGCGVSVARARDPRALDQ